MTVAVDWDIKHQFKQTNKPSRREQTNPTTGLMSVRI